MLKNSLRQLLEVSLMISPLIILIFLLRKKSLRRLGPTARLLLWVPLLIQLAIPVQLTSKHSPYQKLTTIPLADSFAETVEQIETAPIIIHPAQAALSMPPDKPIPQNWTSGEGLVMHWVLGMVVMTTVNGIARVKLKKR